MHCEVLCETCEKGYENRLRRSLRQALVWKPLDRVALPLNEHELGRMACQRTKATFQTKGCSPAHRESFAASSLGPDRTSRRCSTDAL